MDANDSVVVKCESSGTAGVTLDPPCVYLGSSERRRGGIPAVDLIGRLVDAASGSVAGRLGAASSSIDLRSWLLASRSSCQVSAYALQDDLAACGSTVGCFGGVDGYIVGGVFGGGVFGGGVLGGRVFGGRVFGVIAGSAGLSFFVNSGKVPGIADVLGGV